LPRNNLKRMLISLTLMDQSKQQAIVLVF